MSNVGKRRLSVDIQIDLYKRMRISAIKHNCTLTKWLQRAILGRLQWEERYGKKETG